MIVYYRSPSVLITGEVLEVWSPCRRRFLLRHLCGVGVVRGGPDPATPGSTRMAGSVAVVLAASSSPVLAASSPFLHSPGAWVVALAVAVAVPGAVGGACWRRRPPVYRLVGRYRGLPVQIFETTDSRTFGQVRRALVRALEANGQL